MTKTYRISEVAKLLGVKVYQVRDLKRKLEIEADCKIGYIDPSSNAISPPCLFTDLDVEAFRANSSRFHKSRTRKPIPKNTVMIIVLNGVNPDPVLDMIEQLTKNGVAA